MSDSKESDHELPEARADRFSWDRGSADLWHEGSPHPPRSSLFHPEDWDIGGWLNSEFDIIVYEPARGGRLLGEFADMPLEEDPYLRIGPAVELSSGRYGLFLRLYAESKQAGYNLLHHDPSLHPYGWD